MIKRGFLHFINNPEVPGAYAQTISGYSQTNEQHVPLSIQRTPFMDKDGETLVFAS
jgi:hypothetical protein